MLTNPNRTAWLSPALCDPPHRVTHPEKYEALTLAFQRDGWNTNEPALVGYIVDGRVQLLSGSHRWAAAQQAAILIPVMVKSYADVSAAFGDLDAWAAIMISGNNYLCSYVN